MKTNVKILVLAIVATLVLNVYSLEAQGFQLNKNEYFTSSLVVDPVASIKEKGLDVGAEIEYVGLIYAAARVENFEALQGGYTSVTGAIGINFTSGHFNTWRYYVGGRGGVVFRNGAKNGVAGVEAGIDYAFDSGFFIGLRAAYDNRGDMKALNWPVIWRENGYIRIGYRWFWNSKN